MPLIVCISDTHLRHNFDVPPGDILIHAGDVTSKGTIHNNEIDTFLQWFSSLPHKHKIFIAGNHDFVFEKNPREAALYIPDDVIYLQDSEVTVEGLRIYGSPWQPLFHHWAFNLPRGTPIRQKWKLIPKGIDVLITHGPPLGILDHTLDHYDRMGSHVGCRDLRERVRYVKPRLHVFGHIHCGAGLETVDGTTFINASICDERYVPNNRPITTFLDPLVPEVTDDQG